MPTRETPPIGAPCWVDLMTSDTEGSRRFYSELFGWTAEEPSEEFGGYFNFTKDGVQVAGCMARQPGMDMPDVWSIYLATDDARKHRRRGRGQRRQGHRRRHARRRARHHGRHRGLRRCCDRAMAARPAQGLRSLRRAGTPGWFELHTRDYDAAVSFYRDVFRWDAHVDERHARVPLHDARRGRRRNSQASWTPAASCPRVSPRTGPSTSVSRTPTLR